MFAAADGFISVEEMREFFREPHDRLIILWGYPEWFWVIQKRAQNIQIVRIKTLFKQQFRSTPAP